MRLRQTVILAFTSLFAATQIAWGLSISAPPEWVVQGSGTNITVLDCDPFECASGIEISCQGFGQPALVRLPALSSTIMMPTVDNMLALDVVKKNIQLNSIVETNRTRFVRQVEIVLDQNNQFVPQFFMQPNDPFLSQLATDGLVDDLELALNERSSNITLYRAGDALRTFVSNCGWGQSQPAFAATNPPMETQQPTSQLGNPQISMRLTCQNSTDLNGRIVTMSVLDTTTGVTSFRLPPFFANGNSFNPPELKNSGRNDPYFLENPVMQNGNIVGWQALFFPEDASMPDRTVRMNIDVPNYGIIECQSEMLG